ncbi:DUF2268 domain-containing protein [Amphibacillus marinus]|nr:DUF2268 domain-containing putative Zn-dependent protease [Amphibacillus marinus]
MQIIIEDTVKQYDQLFSIAEGREDYFRYTMMKPFKQMWDSINVPLKAKQYDGYDVLVATKMLGYLDVLETELGRQGLTQFKELHILETAQQALNNCVTYLNKNQLHLKADRLRFGAYLADPDKLKLQRGYCGFGGIPGFIQISLFPNTYNSPRLPAVIAHEFHHNIRFSYFNWDHGNVTVGDYLIIEGLAEAFAKELYGEAYLGPWVTALDEEDLLYSMEIIKDALAIKGFAEVSSYMFGDEIAKEHSYHPVGLSPFAGYAVGYHVVQNFLKINKVSVREATLLSTNEILANCNFLTK